MGKPRKVLTNEQIVQVEALAAYLTAEQIADYLSIGRQTFYSIMQRDEEVSRRYKKGRAKGIAYVAKTLMDKITAGDTSSIIFYLKTQARWRETQGIDLSSEDGSMSPERKIIIEYGG